MYKRQHYSYAKQALLHGKNVILEKPFTGFYNEAQELQQIAEENKLFIFEAVTVLHNEVFYEMKKNVEKLGTLRMAPVSYTHLSKVPAIAIVFIFSPFSL